MATTKEELLNQARQNINIIDAQQTEQYMAHGATILDVREPSEFDMGHLPDAVHIPRGLLEFMVGNHPALQDSSKTLVVYCKNGGRSTLATDLLQRMGFSDIHMLAGGFDNWSGTIHKVEIPDNQYLG
ncbi:rhodanese-like domain-containing protein [Oceaniserpentilla sp. 4NH20-0058]|uniref:rhodanese-like domain-containing protein n=1 Tax=Oceaniserpentilla sp. 4NH20-0058 TaxID=3127660 RepID=UPI00310A0C96